MLPPSCASDTCGTRTRHLSGTVPQSVSYVAPFLCLPSYLYYWPRSLPRKKKQKFGNYWLNQAFFSKNPSHNSSHLFLTTPPSTPHTIVTDNIGCTVSFWWRGQGRHSWFFHPRNAQDSSNNLDRNVSGRWYRHKDRTTPIKWVFLVRVQGLWCHVLNVFVWVLLVYRGMDSLSKEE